MVNIQSAPTEPEQGRSRVGLHARRQPQAVGEGATEDGSGVNPRGTVPVWFGYLVVIACAGVLSFGGFGLLLAVVGHFSVVPAFVLGIAGTVAGTVLGRPTPTRAPGSPAPKATAPALGMGVVAISVAIWNSINIGHNVVVASDPGVYLVAGRWLASHSSLIVPAGAPWIDKGSVSVFNWTSPGMYAEPGGTLQFQFAHLLPVLLAEAHHLGGDGLMFRVPAVLNALALCAIYATGCRIIRRPWLTLAAVTALALTLPQLYFSRNTFSEPATQVLLWGGIWLLIRAYDERRVSVAILAGLSIGGTLMTRIDAVAYLIPLPILAAVGWLAVRSRDDRASLVRIYAATAVAVLPPAILGTVDVQRRAGLYYDALHHQLFGLYTLLALSSAALVGTILLARPLQRPVNWSAIRRNQISIVAAWVIGGGLLLAWAVRPAFSKPGLSGGTAYAVAGIQKLDGVPARPETYAEQSMQWISWYLGPATTILAIAGLCLLTVLVIRRGSPAALVVLAMAAPLTAIYIWNPSITPIQIWAMRRYVPASLPLMVLAAAVAVEGAASVCRRLFRGSAWSRQLVLIGGAAMILFPLGTLLPVRNFQVQANYLPLVDSTCDMIGPNGAVLFPVGDYDGDVLTQTLRSWCNVPVTSLQKPISQSQLQTIASDFRNEGKTLWVLGTTPGLISQSIPGLSSKLVGVAISPRELEQTVDRPPQHYTRTTLTIYGIKVS